MKLLHLLYSGLGGHGNVFFSFLSADENKQFENEAIFAGVEPVREEYSSKCNASNIPWKYLKKQTRLDIGFNRKLVNTIQASQSSIIFLHGSRFIVLAAIGVLLSKNKKRIVVRETQANHLKTWLEWVWLALALLLADRIVFLTDDFKAAVKKKLSLLWQANKITVINNGIDLTLFSPEIKSFSKAIVLGMQSRIVSLKDHATLLKALALLQEQHPGLSLQLKIAGDGGLLVSMQQLAKQLGISDKIEFTGTLNETELVNFLQSLDIYIHASLGETMSTAIMQAMACGLPVIASDVPGINNMIEKDITGVLIPAKNEAALANALYELIHNPSKANTMRKAAHKYAQLHFNNTLMFAKYLALIKSMENR